MTLIRMSNYRNVRSNSLLSDSNVVGNFNRSSTSPRRLSVNSQLSSQLPYTYKRFRRRSFSNDDLAIPTLNLKAHSPPKYTFEISPFERNFNKRYYYMEDDVNILPRIYNTYYPRFHRTQLNSLNSYDDYLTSYFRNPKYNMLFRIPENQYYYRYNVLPHHGYDANDMIRQRRRKLISHSGYYSDFRAPSTIFFSGMKNSLNNIHDKMEHHRLLLDRYTGIDMTPNSSSVGENILEKSMQMIYKKRY